MEAKVNKVTALIKQVRYMEVEISYELGFEMPTTIDEVVELHNSLKDSPGDYITDVSRWDLEEQTVTDIKYT